MTRAASSAALVLVVAIVATGCGESESGEGAPVEPSSSSTADPGSPEPSPDPSAGPADAAVADLATRLGIEPAAVEVVSVEEVTWRDGSLGCAQPGMVYTQALVEGSRIVLRAEGAEHEYHQGGAKPPFRCAEPTQ